MKEEQRRKEEAKAIFEMDNFNKTEAIDFNQEPPS